MTEYTARQATPEEIAQAAATSRELLINIGKELFREGRQPRELKDCLEIVTEALMSLQKIYAAAAQRGGLSPEETLNSSVYFLTAAAVMRTMQNNPLYGTRALIEQIEHNFNHIARTGQTVGGVVYQPKE